SGGRSAPWSFGVCDDVAFEEAGWTWDVSVKWSPLPTTVCKRSVPLSQKKASSRRRSGSFRLTHFRSIRNFWLTSSSLVTGCLFFSEHAISSTNSASKESSLGGLRATSTPANQKN